MADKGPKEIAQDAVNTTKEYAGRAIGMGTGAVTEARTVVLDAQRRVCDVADDVAEQATSTASSATQRAQELALEAKEKTLAAATLAQTRTQEIADNVHDKAFSVASIAQSHTAALTGKATNAYRMIRGVPTLDSDLDDESRSRVVAETESALETPVLAIESAEQEEMPVDGDEDATASSDVGDDVEAPEAEDEGEGGEGDQEEVVEVEEAEEAGDEEDPEAENAAPEETEE